MQLLTGFTQEACREGRDRQTRADGSVAVGCLWGRAPRSSPACAERQGFGLDQTAHGALDLARFASQDSGRHTNLATTTSHRLPLHDPPRCPPPHRSGHPRQFTQSPADVSARIKGSGSVVGVEVHFGRWVVGRIGMVKLRQQQVVSCCAPARVSVCSSVRLLYCVRHRLAAPWCVWCIKLRSTLRHDTAAGVVVQFQ